MPIAGYYEWQTDGKLKRPHYIYRSGNAPAMLLAGLWTSVTLPDYTGLTCTIITEASSGPMTTLNDRAPVMKLADAISTWLGGCAIDDNRACLSPASAGTRSARPSARLETKTRS